MVPSDHSTDRLEVRRPLEAIAQAGEGGGLDWGGSSGSEEGGWIWNVFGRVESTAIASILEGLRR